MKIEINESEITKEQLNGETLLPENVKTQKEVHNWILNLSNNDRINEEVPSKISLVTYILDFLLIANQR